MVRPVGDSQNAAAAADAAARRAAEQARQAAIARAQREAEAAAERSTSQNNAAQSAPSVSANSASNADSKAFDNNKQSAHVSGTNVFNERTGIDANAFKQFHQAQFGIEKPGTNGGLPTAENYRSLIAVNNAPPENPDQNSFLGRAFDSALNGFDKARELIGKARAGVDENSFAGKIFKAFDNLPGSAKSALGFAALTGGGLPMMPNEPQSFVGDGIPYDPGKNTGYGKDATPEESAQYVLKMDHGMTYDPDAKTQTFLQALEDHKGDAKWSQDFFNALGPKETADLISNTLTTGPHQHSSPEKVNEQVGLLRDTISNLASAQPPMFTQNDMNTLVEKMVKAPGSFNPLIASELFGKMDFKQENVKNMFFNAASKLAVSGDLSQRESQEIAAAASHVLSNTSSNNQAEKLNELRSSGTGKLTDFIQKAMKGPTEYPTLLGELGTLMQFPGEHGPADSEPYGKVDALLFNAAYGGYHDTGVPGAKVSSADLQATRTELFNAAGNALADDGIRATYADSTLLKDGLSEIYMRDYNALIKGGVGQNGASFNADFKTAQTEFFESALFTDKPGNLQKSLMNFTADKFKEMNAGLRDESPDAEAKFKEKFGMSRSDGANVMGLTLGTMTNALETRNNEIKDNEAAREAAVGFIFDLTIGLIPGVGGKLSEGSENLALKLFGSVADGVQGKILDDLKNGGIEAARSTFIKENGDTSPDKLLFGLFAGSDGTLPDEMPVYDDKGNKTNSTVDFLAKFRSAYTSVISSPDRAARGE